MAVELIDFLGNMYGAGRIVITDANGKTKTAGGSTSVPGAIYIDQTPDNGTYGLLGGSVDGVNVLFTVSQGVYDTGTLVVSLNGQVLTQGAGNDFVETTPASGTFTFNAAPLIGDIITAIYTTSAVGGGFTLANGNGTTAAGSAVDLGGILTMNTTIGTTGSVGQIFVIGGSLGADFYIDVDAKITTIGDALLNNNGTVVEVDDAKKHITLNGAISLPYRVETSDYTVQDGDCVISVNNGGTAVNIFFQDPASVEIGTVLTVKRYNDTSTADVYLQASGTFLIQYYVDGTFVGTSDLQNSFGPTRGWKQTFMSNGTDWELIY